MLFVMALLLSAGQQPLPPAKRSHACAGLDDARTTPAGRLQRLDDFRTSLVARDRHRLDRALPRDADGGIAQCDGIDRSRASCEAAAYLPALRSSGLMEKFVASVCRGKSARGDFASDPAVSPRVAHRGGSSR
ncbi:hypothetical protein [Sphingomonas sp. M1A8_2b]